jgi:predicted DNA-binding protein YlxM (UPF0122 family)
MTHLEATVESVYDALDTVNAELHPFQDHGRIYRAREKIREAMDELEYVMDDPTDETESV